MEADFCYKVGEVFLFSVRGHRDMLDYSIFLFNSEGGVHVFAGHRFFCNRNGV